jgi:hypothetical protein
MAAQLVLYDPEPPRVAARPARRREARMNPTPAPILCAACRSREARYGFQPDKDDPLVERPRTLCFECFRLELGRRQDAARAIQVRLPLEETLETLRRRRRRAQIAARHALNIR